MGLPVELYLAFLICGVGVGAAAVAARRRRSFQRVVAALDLAALERLARASLRRKAGASGHDLGRALRALLAPLPTSDLVRPGNAAVAGEAAFPRLVFSAAYALLFERRRSADREQLRRQRWPSLAVSFLEARPSPGPSDQES